MGFEVNQSYLTACDTIHAQLIWAVEQGRSRGKLWDCLVAQRQLGALSLLRRSIEEGRLEAGVCWRVAAVFTHGDFLGRTHRLPETSDGIFMSEMALLLAEKFGQTVLYLKTHELSPKLLGDFLVRVQSAWLIPWRGSSDGHVIGVLVGTHSGGDYGVVNTCADSLYEGMKKVDYSLFLRMNILELHSLLLRYHIYRKRPFSVIGFANK